MDRDAQPCAPGEFGRLLVTVFSNAAMPLIRYDVDDMAQALDDGPCPCGRTLPSFGPVIGRYSQIAALPPGTLDLADALRGAMEALRPPLSLNLREYQVHQYRNGRFELRLVTAGPMPAAFEAHIQGVWRAVAPGRAPLSIRAVDSIPLAPSLKFFHFTSDFIASKEAERSRA